MIDFSPLKKKLASFIVVLACVSALLKQSHAQCIDNYEPNDEKKYAVQIQTNVEYHALISTSLDIDWFEFIVTPTEPNLLIRLFELPENYNILLYDSNKAKIGWSKNKGTRPDTIIMNELPTAKYFVKVRGRAGHYDPSQCYKLILMSSAVPFREATVADDFVNAHSQFELYPNPATDKLIIQLEDDISSAEFSIYNLMGQKISEMKDVQLDENAKTEIDVSALSAGEYLLKISYDTGTEVKKFVINK